MKGYMMYRRFASLMVCVLLALLLTSFVSFTSAKQVNAACDPPRTGTGYSATIYLSSYPYSAIGAVVLVGNECGQRASQVISFQNPPYLTSITATIRDQVHLSYTATGSTSPVWSPTQNGLGQACGTIYTTFGSGSACTSGYH